MLKLFEKAAEPTVEFCDRCASVCDARCRSGAIRDRALDAALRLRAGL